MKKLQAKFKKRGEMHYGNRFYSHNFPDLPLTRKEILLKKMVIKSYGGLNSTGNLAEVGVSKRSVSPLVGLGPIDKTQTQEGSVHALGNYPISRGKSRGSNSNRPKRPALLLSSQNPPKKGRLPPFLRESTRTNSKLSEESNTNDPQSHKRDFSNYINYIHPMQANTRVIFIYI